MYNYQTKYNWVNLRKVKLDRTSILIKAIMAHLQNIQSRINMASFGVSIQNSKLIVKFCYFGFCFLHYLVWLWRKIKRTFKFWNIQIISLTSLALSKSILFHFYCSFMAIFLETNTGLIKIKIKSEELNLIVRVVCSIFDHVS